MPHTELRAAPLDLGFLPPQPPIPASGTQHSATWHQPTDPQPFPPTSCAFSGTLLSGGGPSPSQAQNKHTHPCPPTHGCPWEQRKVLGVGFQASFHLSI